jgi:ATP-dependent DNA helicase DinG
MMKHDPKNPTDGILLDSNFVILDEAHKIPETACQVFGKELPATAVPKYLNAMQHACNRKKISSVAYGAFLEQAAKENAALFALLRTSENQTADDDSGQAQVVLTDSMKKHMKKLIGLIREIENYSVEQPHYKGVRSEGIVKALETFPVSSSILLWLSTDPETEAVSLCCAPKNLEPMMRGTLWNEPDTHRVLTSGTMRDDTGFSYFREELGLGAVESALISEHTCDSPFDYQNHTRLYISENVGFPDNSSDTYLDEAAREVTALVKATNGHTAVLFTSYKVLSAVFDRVKDELSAFSLIRMTRSNRGAIDEFRKSGNGVLFASGSMWEGVDCIGDILSSVIIVKLPFPLRTELLEQKKKKCATVQDFIQAYAVPQMLIKLRQGAGRLIRCESDTGVLSILDARAAKGGNYRNRVLASLAKYPIAESVEEIADFISAVKPKTYFQTEES